MRFCYAKSLILQVAMQASPERRGASRCCDDSGVHALLRPQTHTREPGAEVGLTKGYVRVMLVHGSDPVEL
jgi:hypothetical protein